MSACPRWEVQAFIRSVQKMPYSKFDINIETPHHLVNCKQYFCCGNYTSSHWECGKGKGLCADCMKNSVSSGSRPLQSCGSFESYMQMDRDTFFPQIELLDEIHAESPNATFLLMFRNMTEWYRRCSGYSLLNLSLPNNILHCQFHRPFLQVCHIGKQATKQTTTIKRI